MKRHLTLPVGLALLFVVSAFAQQSGKTADTAPWHVSKVAKFNTARGGGDAASATSSPQKYLHVTVAFNDSKSEGKKHRFRVTDQAGKEVGELWGWNKRRSLVIFEGRWDSLVGLYLDASGHREPLFRAVTAAAPVVARRAPVTTIRPAVRENPVVRVQPRTVHVQPRTVHVPQKRIIRTEPDRIVYTGPDRVIHTGPDRVIHTEPDRVIRHGGTTTHVHHGERDVKHVYRGGGTKHVHHGRDSTTHIHHGERDVKHVHHDGDSTTHIHHGERDVKHVHHDGDSTTHVHHDGDSTKHIHHDGDKVVHRSSGSTGVQREGAGAMSAGLGEGGSSSNGSAGDCESEAGKSANASTKNSGVGPNGEPCSNPSEMASSSNPNGQSPNAMSPNGQSPNSQCPNGQGPNAMSPNAMGPNGQCPNGQSPNGMSPNAMASAGMPMGPNAMGPNGQCPNGQGPGAMSPNAMAGPGSPGCGPSGMAGPGMGGSGEGGCGKGGPGGCNPYAGQMRAKYGAKLPHYAMAAFKSRCLECHGMKRIQTAQQRKPSPEAWRKTIDKMVRKRPKSFKRDDIPLVSTHVLENFADASKAGDSGPGELGVAVYVACGGEKGPGKVYQLSEKGRVLGTVDLPSTATGIALHRDRNLVVTIPGAGGIIARIDENGRASTVLAKNATLVHPVDVGVVAGSDTILVADNIANLVAATNTGGATPKVYQRFESPKWMAKNMSIAVAGDNSVIFGTKGGEGVYRFSGRTGSVSATSLLPGSGGVAADPKSRRWAATQEPNQIYLFEGQKLVDKYRLPTDKSFYRNGLLSFGPSGSLVVATRPNEESAKNVSLLLFTSKEFAEATGKPQVRALFDWNGEPIADFVVGPPAQWQSDTKVGYKTPR